MKENKKIIIICSFVTLILLVAFLYKKISNNKNNKVTNNISYINTDNIKYTTVETRTRTVIVVEIKGEVYYPGVYSFYQDEVLVEDVIAMAGGLTPKADTSLLNCASIVENHSSITIGRIDSSSHILKENETLAKININTATIDELKSLDGIGTVKAEKIINYRKKYGYFLSTHELVEKEIITEALFEKIKDYITV